MIRNWLRWRTWIRLVTLTFMLLFVLVACGGDSPVSLVPQQNHSSESVSSITVTDQIVVESFSLIDTDTSQPVPGFESLTDGIDLNLPDLPPHLSIEANTQPGTVGQVIMALQGPTNRTQSEEVYPYALFGNTNEGEAFVPWRPDPPLPGSYQLTATPLGTADDPETAGTPLSISFNLTNTIAGSTRVDSFALVDASTHRPVPGFESLVNNAVLTLDQLPPELSIQANTSPTTVGSVSLTLEGPTTQTQVEGVAPYALFGDRFGNFNAWDPTPPLEGTYTLTATPYSEGQASGEAGNPLSISFSIQPTTPQITNAVQILNANQVDGQPLTIGDPIQLQALADQNGVDVSDQIQWLQC